MSALEALDLNRETNQQIITHINRSTTEGRCSKGQEPQGYIQRKWLRSEEVNHGGGWEESKTGSLR